MSLLRNLQSYIPDRSIDEFELFEEAKKLYPKIKFEEITNSLLKKMTKEVGIEKTTAFFYHKLIHLSNSSKFIKKINSTPVKFSNLPKLKNEVWVIPAGFYRDIPEFDGDGELIRKIGSHFGTQSRLIEVNPKGSITNNANEIIVELEKTNANNLIVFSISKGSADLRVALENRPDLQKKIFVWITIGGLLKNNPLADVLLDKTTFRKLIQKTVLQILGIPFEFLTEFSTLSGILTSPINIQIKNQITLLPIPLPSHMQGNILKKHRILSEYGPNDGYGLLTDSILPESYIIPAWGTDHYFRTPMLSEILYKVFFYISSL
ncbi:hypothetical protein CH372_08610 [Leptospira meyeri]|uniref:hypothetical protein n=1 Tax=Leptospira meyeri TaxID=29508 RepID=UPI000C295DCD|nr:hypothetical protein [Leptospira meyeri]PKA12519.1 hypothetical protein CH372_08610 [Leptospira meyeri]